MNIGEQINNLRKQHGLSQDDFAIYFNVLFGLFLIGRMVFPKQKDIKKTAHVYLLANKRILLLD